MYSDCLSRRVILLLSEIEAKVLTARQRIIFAVSGSKNKSSGSVVGRDTMLQARKSTISDEVIELFSYVQILPAELYVHSASNRNEYQESFWGSKARPKCKTDNLTAIREKLWEALYLNPMALCCLLQRQFYVF
jgi:hypothetical protein